MPQSLLRSDFIETHTLQEELVDHTKHMLAVALAQAELGLSEGGIPIGAAIFRPERASCSAQAVTDACNRKTPRIHGETDAFRRAGRQRSYRDLIMVTTLAPCWYCTGLIRQFGFRTVVVGESVNFAGGLASLRELGIHVIDLASQRCINLLADYIRDHPAIWNEDIGEDAS